MITDKTKRAVAYEKTEKVIESCETYQQLVRADNMIDNFKMLYGSDNDYARALDCLYLDKACDTNLK